jgi:dephospho-CoA kinase
MCTDASTPFTTPAGSPAERPRRASAPGAFVVGLVGPAGAGKSTVARALAADGARVLDGDALGHEVADHDPEVRAALIEDYGPQVYRADGTLDRKQVAARVFSDPAALTRLNQLVHPRILARLRAGIAEAAHDGFTGVLVIDAALLLDWGFERECDAVLAVLAPAELQVERLVATRGWSADEARRRLANARASDSFAALADEVVRNDGSEACAVERARAAVARLRARRGVAS